MRRPDEHRVERHPDITVYWSIWTRPRLERHNVCFNGRRITLTMWMDDDMIWRGRNGGTDEALVEARLRGLI